MQKPRDSPLRLHCFVICRFISEKVCVEYLRCRTSVYASAMSATQTTLKGKVMINEIWVDESVNVTIGSGITVDGVRCVVISSEETGETRKRSLHRCYATGRAWATERKVKVQCVAV